MAAITSAQSGSWGDTATWTGGVVPGDGDTATIATGHEISTDGDVTIGDSPGADTTAVLAVNGRLLHTSGTLTAKGAVLQDATTGTNGQVVASAGTHIVIDGGGTRKYRWMIGNSASTTARLYFNGTAESRCTMSSTGTGTTNGYGSYPGQQNAGLVEATYTDFTRIGDSANNCFIGWSNATTARFLFNRCTFTSCGQLSVGVAFGASSYYSVTNCQWFSTLSTYCASLSYNATFTAGTRQFSNNRCDKSINVTSGHHLTIEDNVFRSGYVWTASATVFAASVARNVVDATADRGTIQTTSPSTNPNTDSYWYAEGSNNNPHPVSFGTPANVYLRGHIFDLDSGTVGDMIIGGSSGQTIDIRECIELPNSAGTNQGKLCSPVGGFGAWTIEHCTCVTTALPGSNAEDGIANIGETLPGTSGLYASVKSNIAYSPSGQGAVLVGANQNTRETQTGANFSYNAISNPATSVGSGVVAVYAPGYVDVTPANVTCRVPSASSGSFTLLVYHSDEVTTAETASIAYNATGSTVASAVQTALNTLSDGTYACTAVDASTPASSLGSRMTITRDSVAISTERVLSIIRAGGTNTTGVTLYVSRPVVDGTPGANDLLNEDPEFVDETRNLATFDTAYLGNTATAWATATSYSAGNIVSASDAGFYGSATINFRCKSAHTSVAGNATTGQPGVATNWRTNWEYASIYRLHQSVAAYDADTPQATPRDLIEWVRAGWAPTNPAYREAGHDGEDIGAVAGVYASGDSGQSTIVIGPARFRIFGPDEHMEIG
jgi:hypothetical protein